MLTENTRDKRGMIRHQAHHHLTLMSLTVATVVFFLIKIFYSQWSPHGMILQEISGTEGIYPLASPVASKLVTGVIYGAQMDR